MSRRPVPHHDIRVIIYMDTEVFNALNKLSKKLNRWPGEIVEHMVEEKFNLTFRDRLNKLLED